MRRPSAGQKWLARWSTCEHGRVRAYAGREANRAAACGAPAVAWLDSPSRREVFALCARHVWQRLGWRAQGYGWMGGRGLGKSTQILVGPGLDLLADEAEMVAFVLAYPKPPPKAEPARLF